MDFLFSFSKGMPGTSNVSDPARRALCVRNDVATIAASQPAPSPTATAPQAPAEQQYHFPQYESACDNGDGKACNDFANQIYSAARTNKNEQALALVNKGCLYKYGPACVQLGNNLHLLYSADTSRIMELYRQGCADGEAAGCANIAAYNSRFSDDMGLQKNEALANQYQQMACDLATVYCLSGMHTSNQTAVAQPDTNSQSQPPQAAQAEADTKAQEISDKIDELNSDIEMHQQAAAEWDDTATKAMDTSSCTSPLAQAICQSMGQIGAAKARADANKERNAIADDQAQIARLQGQRNATAQHLDTSFGGNLQTNNSTGYNQTTNNFNTNTFSNANNGDAAVAACKNGNPYQNDNSLCQSNPNLQQASCYRAAADICRCYLNAYPGNSNSSQWQSCVVNNDAKADQLNSSSHSVGGGTTQTNSNGNSGNSGNINLNNCSPGAIGCAGVAK
jgi:hypothetical protein